MPGIAHTIRFHTTFINLSDDLKTWDMYLEHRIPQLGETIRINNGNRRHRVVSIENQLAVPVEESDTGPTMGFYDTIIIEVEEV